MVFGEFLSYCFHYDSNIQILRVIGVNNEIQKLLPNRLTPEVITNSIGTNGNVISITATIQYFNKEYQLKDREVVTFGIETDNILYVKLE